MLQYGRAAVEAIIGQYCDNWLVIDDAGVWLSNEAINFDVDQTVRWKYVCELDGPDAPDPLEAPCLPIPCTANELAAFMLDGPGAMLPTVYGSLETGPDQSMLDRMGILASKSRDALKSAYQAHRDSTAIVGCMDGSLGRLKSDLADQFEQENGDANAREGVFAVGISRDEQRARRERAVASIRDLSDRCNEADAAYRSKFAKWRKAMVNQLIPSEVRDTFRRQWRALRLNEERLSNETEELMKINPASITELETKRKSLSSLRAELEKVRQRLQSLKSTMPQQLQRDAEISYTIEKMKRSRAIGEPHSPADDWQKDDADITRTSQEIDAPPISSSEASSKDKPCEIIHPEDPVAAQPWYTAARYFARQLVKNDSTLLLKKALLTSKVSLMLERSGYYKRGGKKPLSQASVLKALANIKLV